MPVWRGLKSWALVASAAAALVACGGEPDKPPSSPAVTPTPAATATATATAPPTATPEPAATPSQSPHPHAPGDPTPTPSPTPSPTPTATQAPTEYVPLTLGEPRPLPPGATLYFREYSSCHGPQWWHRAIATEAGDLAWDNPFAKLPSIHADDWGPENWPPQLEGVSASGQTLVAEVCERGACQSFDRVDPDAAKGIWGSVDAGETWERWGDYPEGSIGSVKEGDIAFRDTDGRLKGFRSGEAWVPPEKLPRPSVRSWVDGRLGHEEREPGELDLYLLRDQGAVLGAYSWGGEESYESHRPLWLIDHLEGQLFVGFLGSHACGEGTKTVLVDFGSGTVHPIPGLDPGRPILHKALLAEPPTPSSTPTPDTTTFQYDSYGPVLRPGTYVFLKRGGNRRFDMVTTYEGLRDGSTTALTIHKSDTSDTSRADVYDAVQAGDIFEWWHADDCFVRYQVEEVRNDSTGDEPAKALDIKAMTYAFTGCSGPIPADATATFDWGELPDLGGTSLTAPVVHGTFQIVPEDWEGEVKSQILTRPDGFSAEKEADSLTEARSLDLWREPTELPRGWTFGWAGSGGYGSHPYGYCATFLTEERTYQGRSGRYEGVQICGYHAGSKYNLWDAAWNEGAHIRETRVLAGRPAVVLYSPPGPKFDGLTAADVYIYDPATETEYSVLGKDTVLLDDVNVVIAIAESLFENAPVVPAGE